MPDTTDYYPDLMKINVQYSGERNTAENVLYASCLGAHGATSEDLTTLAEDIGSSWATHFMPYISSAYALANVLVADWTDSDGLTGEYPNTTAGGLTGDILTDQVAMLINYETLMRYRGGRGRMYLPAPDATVIDSGTAWTDDQVTHITTACEGVFDYINTLSVGDDLLTVVLYHRPGSKVVVQGFEEIAGVSCSPVPGTQRRRVRRVGHLR